jgi:drug/metabolite transporter (DMT)-like permease
MDKIMELLMFKTDHRTPPNTSLNRWIASPAAGIWMALSAALLFSLKGIWVKLAYRFGIEPAALMTLRMGFSLPIYLGLALWWVSRGVFAGKPLRKFLAPAAAIGVVGYYLASFLDLTGLQFISAPLERVVLFSYPALTVILSYLFQGERLNRAVYVVLPISWLGIGLMALGESGLELGGNHSAVITGVSLVAASALSFAFYLLISKPLVFAIGGQLFTCIAMISASLAIFTHFSLTNEWQSLWTQPPEIYSYAACIALFSTVLPSFLFSAAIARVGPSKAAISGSIGPVMTLILAILILGETVITTQWIGMTIVVLAISYLTQSQRRQLKSNR